MDNWCLHAMNVILSKVLNVRSTITQQANDPGVNLNNPSVLAAAAKFKKLASAKNELSASAARLVNVG